MNKKTMNQDELKTRRYLEYFKKLDDPIDTNEPVVFKTTSDQDYFLDHAVHHVPTTVVPDDVEIPLDSILNIDELLDDRKQAI